jgi:alkanesulfonate monooxygenase SsuD/methylene tetrahydromethanopterin reductase-like flavin-dependent oxidoreductase (luciferase family)
MKAIWTQDEASYHGELVDFDPMWSWPKPVTKPHPPILMGGAGPKALDRVLDYADGWAPNAMPFEVLAERCAELQRRAGELGRGPVPVSVFLGEADPDVLRRMEEIGIARAVVWIEPGPRDEVEPALDRLATMYAR